MSEAQPLQAYIRPPGSRIETVHVDEATPVLLLGLLEKIAQAKASLADKDPLLTGFYLGRASCIVDNLRNSLQVDSNSVAAKGFDHFYALIDECFQKAVGPNTQQYLDLAEEFLRRASDWWILNNENGVIPGGHA